MIVAGPWIGEFGWELFCWQAILREIAETEKLIVVSRKNSKALYEDFASEFIGLDTPLGIADCSRFIPQTGLNWELSGEEHIKPSDSFFYWENNPIEVPEFGLIEPQFQMYGRSWMRCGYDLVLCPRMRQLAPERNWRDWDELVQRLPTGLKIAVVGTKSEAAIVEGADNLHDQPLAYIMDVMASAKLAIGPSSGTMHLAGLCGCPRLVFNAMTQDHIRYLKFWNPFKIETDIITSWLPTAELVAYKVKQIIGT